MDKLLDTDLNIENAALYIYDHFGYDENVQKAILNGSMGKYGITYKLNTQVIGNWIYEYIKKPKKYNDSI